MRENLRADSHPRVCVSVVDGPDGETPVKKSLHKEAVKAILNGAAVFFPDKSVRRDKLFHMMVSSLDRIIAWWKWWRHDDVRTCLSTEKYHRGRAVGVGEGDFWITLQLLQVSILSAYEHTRANPARCGFAAAKETVSLRSDQDPSGLLLLPPKGAPADFDISPMLSVMETLLLVATKEVRVLRHHNISRKLTEIFLRIWCRCLFISVTSWWRTGAVEPAGQCCCPCSGRYKLVYSPGATCSSKAAPPPPSIWTWPETFFRNVSDSDSVAQWQPFFSQRFVARFFLCEITQLDF